MDKFLMTDTSGVKSVTMTAFVWGFIVVNLKLLLSGIAFSENIKMSEFTGSDYGMALAALGAIYVMRRKTQADAQNVSEE